jgi:hypothetical protein
MPDAETAALLRAVLDDLCSHVPASDGGTRTNVASRLLATIQQGKASIDELKHAGMLALRQSPTMWR